MSSRASKQHYVALVLALFVVGAAAAFLSLAPGPDGEGDLDAAPSPGTGPPALLAQATATEPILPPPPTVSATASVATPSASATQAALIPPSGTRPTSAGTDSPSPSPPPLPSQPVTATSTEPVPTATSLAANRVGAVTPMAEASTGLDASSALVSPSPVVPPTRAGMYTLRQRLGVCGGGPSLAENLVEQLGFGWYLNWSASVDRIRTGEVTYMPMVRLKDGQPQPGGQVLLQAVDANPGAVWLIGNEPDVKWQDNVAPEVYARAYHDLYALLKERDPTCKVAIGGVSQPTPLRLRYLDRILETYQQRYGQPMPVDIWNVHNFVLREERDSWGVDIPPGLSDQAGVLREIADHDDLEIFRQQIVDFRRWMAARGQQDKPLIITEYGILMPPDYGFPPDRVERFMLATFEFFRTAADPALGYPADGHRLVQRWCWFSLADARYPTGDLLRQGNQSLTPLGEAFGRYAHVLP